MFLAAYQGAARFEGRSSLATWLYKIAVYRWRNMLKTRRLETVSLEETAAVLSADPAQSGIERITLENALAALSEPLREAFLLVKGEGFLCREAADILGIPEGTLKARVYSAILKLQNLLETPEEIFAPHKQPDRVIQPKEILQ